MLILGLETKPDRDLDAFQTDGKTYKFPGFHAHFTPKIETLMEKILHLGQTATPVNCADFKLKQLAVMAGLGRWSKNSMVIHARFGLRLRFVALQVDFNFETTLHDKRATFTRCANCARCIHACPCNALVPFALPDKTKCQAYKDLTDSTKKTRCDLCVRACPANGETNTTR